MAYTGIRVSAMADELVALIKTLPLVNDRSFYVYNVDKELKAQQTAGFPAISVGWEGTEMLGTGSSHGTGVSTRSAQALKVFFSISVAIEYQPMTVDETKDVGTDLVEDIRDAVLGYHGVNNRPYILVREQPVYGLEMEGVVVYGQMWETTLTYKSNPT